MYNVSRTPAMPAQVPVQSGSTATPAVKRSNSAIDVEMEDVSLSRDDNQKRARSGAAMGVSLLEKHFETSVPIVTDVTRIHEALSDASAHIGAQKAAFAKSSSPHVRSAAGMLNRTLCLADRFNQGDSTLTSFAQPAKGTPGHYIRSFAHDLLVGEKAKEKQEAVMGMMDKTGRKYDSKKLAANSGHVPNVQSFQLHRELKKTETTAREEALAHRTKAAPLSGGELYDASLKYRTDVTKYVAAELRGAQHLTVGAHNDYPNVMVHFNLAQWLSPELQKDKKALETACASFHQFLMSHYSGIVNAEAAKRGLTTATVERSSFGHLTPSVAPTGDSFRVNLGMMPPAYAEAHVSALKILDQELGGLDRSRSQRHKVNPTDSKFDWSTHAVALNEAKSSVDLAFTKADSSNKTLLYNTVRTLDARNSVDSRAYQDHIGLPTGGHSGTALNDSLNELLSKAIFSKKGNDGKVTLSTEARPQPYNMSRDARAAAPSPDAMEVDKPDPFGLSGTYDTYLAKYRGKFASIPVKRPYADAATDTQIRAIAGTLHAGNPEIATSLDVANQLLMVHALDRMDNGAVVPSADIGYGSDSDVEDAGKIAGNKLITHNGMRSLLTSVATARDVLFDANAGKVDIAYDRPYFETQGGVKDVEIEVKVARKDADAKIVVKDINACVTNGEPGEEHPDGVAAQFPNAKAWIIDTTSATTTQMQGIYQQFKKADNAQLLYFSSSGLKNEQGGADNNNYGTTRVFAKPLDGKTGKDVVGEVLGGIEETDRGVATFSHEYRRSMKAMGLVPTTNNIVVSVDETFSGER